MDIKGIRDPLELLQKISLHDVRISHAEYDTKTKSFTLDVRDLYASYEGSPEYPGARPCSLVFEKVKTFFMDITTREGIRITDARIRKGTSDIRLELDLNLGGGQMTEGRSSILTVFETIQIKDLPQRPVSASDKENQNADRVWKPGENCPQPGD